MQTHPTHACLNEDTHTCMYPINYTQTCAHRVFQTHLVNILHAILVGRQLRSKRLMAFHLAWQIVWLAVLIIVSNDQLVGNPVMNLNKSVENCHPYSSTCKNLPKKIAYSSTELWFESL